MPVSQFHAHSFTGPETLEALVERSVRACQYGDDAESRAHLTCIFELLAVRERTGFERPQSA